MQRMSVRFIPKWSAHGGERQPAELGGRGGARRGATMAGTDRGMVAERTGLLAAFFVVCAAFAMRAFRVYQRSV